MKLNLLPATVSKGAKARNAWIGSILLILVGAGASAFMIIKSQQDLRDIKQKVADARGPAQTAYETSAQADTIITKAELPIRNTLLANAMIAHNAKYPQLYDELQRSIPSFFRVTRMSASPIDANTSRIDLQGTLETYQQYADLMLALLKFKGTMAVGRNNYVPTEQIVPALTPADQAGRPRRANEAPVPDDPLERLTYFQGQGSTEAFTGVGNFGSATPDTRFALPDSSLIEVSMVVARDLRVPDARGTLQAAPAPTAGGAGGGLGGAPVSGMPSGFGGPGGAPSGAPVGRGAGSPSRGGAEDGE